MSNDETNDEPDLIGTMGARGREEGEKGPQGGVLTLKQTAREGKIVRTSVLGIIANVLLAAFKAAVGVLSHSIAITMDAVNNLSDALSSVITIVGTKLAAKPADRKHPMGYGRVEYISATIIAVIVLYAGVTSVIDSVQKILAPETPDYTPVVLLVVVAGIVAKVLLGLHVRSVGHDVKSESLVASGTDALSDAILSVATLGAAIVYLATGVSLEAWVGAVISVFIVRAGAQMLAQTLGEILGERVTPEVAQQVKDIVLSDPDVLGVYDLVLHSYGPERLVGSLHVEVKDTLGAADIDRMTRRIEYEVAKQTKGYVLMAAVGIYARNSSPQVTQIRNDVARRVMAHDGVKQLHGFHVDLDQRVMTFDVVITFDVPDRKALCQHIADEVRGAYPDYQVFVTLDSDVSD